MHQPFCSPQTKPQQDFFSEPSQASLTCTVDPAAYVPDARKLEGAEGREVFSEKKGISLFKVRLGWGVGGGGGVWKQTSSLLTGWRVALQTRQMDSHCDIPPAPPPIHVSKPNNKQDKTLRVRRLYDPDRRNLLYVAYSTRLSTAADEGGVSTGRYRTSICAVHLPNAPPVGAPAALPSAAVGADAGSAAAE
jgi:hypothetical protein